jgi:hypothetical protein
MFMRGQPARSIVKRTTTWLAVIVAAAATVTAVSASPSFAAGAPANAQATIPGGYGYFTADGSLLTARDTKADGYGVVVVYYRYDLAKTGPYYLWDRDGNGTSRYRALQMPYGAEIKLYACPEQDGMILDYKCGTRAFGYAGSEI